MIPKVIHYCWFGGTPKPKSVLKCINSWKKYCPDFEIREWTEKDFDVTQNLYCKQAYEAEVWGFVPDYIRLWIIYHYGGIYLDTDVQVVKSFEPLLNNKAFAGFEEGKGRFVNFGQGFGAEAGNVVIKTHMLMYEDMQFLLPDGTYNKTPSPHYTTEALVKHGLDREKRDIQVLDDITVFPADYFCPKSFQTGLIERTPNTYSIHHFDASWYEEEHRKAREKWLREVKKDRLRHLPNRILMNLLGNDRYEKLKKLLKGK